MQLEVLKFYRHARVEEEWVADPSPTGNPAVQLALASADGTPVVQQWFVADPFTDEVFLGPVKLAFQRASVASMLEDFSSPPSGGGATDGILSMHYDGRMYRIPVKDNVGKKVAVGKSDIRVEIASYLPDARPDAAAHFTTVSQQPNNPLLELKVYLPGKEATLAANRLRQESSAEPGWNSRLELPGQVLVPPSGDGAGSGHAIFANTGG